MNTRNNTRAEILETAESLINGARAETWGPPVPMFTMIGRLFGATLGIPDIEPATAALLLTQLKIARAAHNPSVLDSYIDGAGYLALSGEVASIQSTAGHAIPDGEANYSVGLVEDSDSLARQLETAREQYDEIMLLFGILVSRLGGSVHFSKEELTAAPPRYAWASGHTLPDGGIRWEIIQ